MRRVRRTAHCVDEVDLDFPAGDRLNTLASITHPPVAVLALGSGGRSLPSARRLRVPRPGNRTAQRAGRDVLVHALAGRAPDGHVTLTAFVGGVRNPDLANADLPTVTARVLDDLRALLGAKGEPTFERSISGPKPSRSTISPTGGSRTSWTRRSGGTPGWRWRSCTAKAWRWAR